jgi:hypoxanthine-DNA glycosylase
MDADITDPVPNNFRAMFHLYPEIRLVCFNGTTAHDLYRDYVLPNLDEPQRKIERMTLPSTSSAHARLTFETKVERWSVVWNQIAIRNAPPQD